MSEIQKVETGTVPAPRADGKAHVPVVGGKLKPDSMDGIFRVSNLFFGAGFMSRDVRDQAGAFVVVLTGVEAGLPMSMIIKWIALINGKPAIWGDGAMALCREKAYCYGVREWKEGAGDQLTAFCEAARVRPDGSVEKEIRSFSVANARKAGLWDNKDPWKKYPDRMLQMRARAYALRDVFPDALCGMGVAEEEQDVTGDYTATPQDGRLDVQSVDVQESPKALPVALPEVPEESDDGAAFLASLETVKEK